MRKKESNNLSKLGKRKKEGGKNADQVSEERRRFYVDRADDRHRHHRNSSRYRHPAVLELPAEKF